MTIATVGSKKTGRGAPSHTTPRCLFVNSSVKRCRHYFTVRTYSDWPPATPRLPVVNTSSGPSSRAVVIGAGGKLPISVRVVLLAMSYTWMADVTAGSASKNALVVQVTLPRRMLGDSAALAERGMVCPVLDA